MKTIHAFFLLSAALILSVSPLHAEEVKLIKNNSLENWNAELVDKNVKKADVWSVRDGVLVCKGKPLGYLATKSSHKNFKLTFEWRWASDAVAKGREPNSGVLLRIAGEPVGFMPKCVEAQLKSGSAGDIWAFRGAKVDGPKERIKQIKAHKDLGDFKGVAKTTDAEKPLKQWNHYEIICKGGKLTLKINGKLVNQATGLEQVSGPIGFQSEGAEIHFRNIVVTDM